MLKKAIFSSLLLGTTLTTPSLYAAQQFPIYEPNFAQTVTRENPFGDANLYTSPTEMFRVTLPTLHRKIMEHQRDFVHDQDDQRESFTLNGTTYMGGNKHHVAQTLNTLIYNPDPSFSMNKGSSQGGNLIRQIQAFIPIANVKGRDADYAHLLFSQFLSFPYWDDRILEYNNGNYELRQDTLAKAIPLHLGTVTGAFIIFNWLKAKLFNAQGSQLTNREDLIDSISQQIADWHGRLLEGRVGTPHNAQEQAKKDFITNILTQSQAYLQKFNRDYVSAYIEVLENRQPYLKLDDHPLKASILDRRGRPLIGEASHLFQPVGLITAPAEQEDENSRLYTFTSKIIDSYNRHVEMFNQLLHTPGTKERFNDPDVYNRVQRFLNNLIQLPQDFDLNAYNQEFGAILNALGTAVPQNEMNTLSQSFQEFLGLRGNADLSQLALLNDIQEGEDKHDFEKIEHLGQPLTIEVSHDGQGWHLERMDTLPLIASDTPVNDRPHHTMVYRIPYYSDQIKERWGTTTSLLTIDGELKNTYLLKMGGVDDKYYPLGNTQTREPRKLRLSDARTPLVSLTPLGRIHHDRLYGEGERGMGQNGVIEWLDQTLNDHWGGMATYPVQILNALGYDPIWMDQFIKYSDIGSMGRPLFILSQNDTGGRTPSVDLNTLHQRHYPEANNIRLTAHVVYPELNDLFQTVNIHNRSRQSRNLLALVNPNATQEVEVEYFTSLNAKGMYATDSNQFTTDRLYLITDREDLPMTDPIFQFLYTRTILYWDNGQGELTQVSVGVPTPDMVTQAENLARELGIQTTYTKKGVGLDNVDYNHPARH